MALKSNTIAAFTVPVMKKMKPMQDNVIRSTSWEKQVTEVSDGNCTQYLRTERKVTRVNICGFPSQLWWVCKTSDCFTVI